MEKNDDFTASKRNLSSETRKKADFTDKEDCRWKSCNLEGV